MSGRAAVALGSNLESRFGDRQANLREAVRRIGALGEVWAVSSFYDTEPVGYKAQPRFLNGALVLETELEPVALMRGLLEVERAMGRVRGGRARAANQIGAEGTVVKGPRVIDLDLLSYTKQDGTKKDGIETSGGDVVMATEELTLPHPEMQTRRFVLEPLAEVAPEWVHPVLGVTAWEMLARLGRDC
jgi:2-amino-4-hydroxy-6-hydroxymethyldihydropteridine diphosphokinase